MDSAYTFQCKKQLSFLKRLFFSPSERGWVRALGEARASGNHLLSAPTPASVWVRLGWSRQSGHLLHSISAAVPCPGRSPTRGSWAAVGLRSSRRIPFPPLPQKEPFPPLQSPCRWQVAEGSPKVVELAVCGSSVCWGDPARTPGRVPKVLTPLRGSRMGAVR